MSIEDLFKSKRERERDIERNRRRAFRSAETVIDNIKEAVDKLKKERDAAWAEARKYMKDGQSAAAKRGLLGVRACELKISQQEARRWTAEQKISQLQMAKTDQELLHALKGVNDVVDIDPETVGEVIGDVDDKLTDQAAVDKAWGKTQEKEMQGVESKTTDNIPSLEALQQQLVDEVAAELETSKPSKGANPSSVRPTTVAAPDVNEQIGEGRRRLRELMDGDK